MTDNEGHHFSDSYDDIAVMPITHYWNNANNVPAVLLNIMTVLFIMLAMKTILQLHY